MTNGLNHHPVGILQRLRCYLGRHDWSCEPVGEPEFYPDDPPGKSSAYGTQPVFCTCRACGRTEPMMRRVRHQWDIKGEPS
jgi:hypothetical protein